MHGALGSAQQFSRLKPLLEEHFNVHDLNFEGHGGRTSENALTMAGFATNIDEFILEKGLKKPNVFGYSMGGYAALSLALEQPEKLGKIVTLGTKFDWNAASAAKEVKMLNPEVIEEKVPKFAAHLKALHAPNDWKELLHKTAGMMLHLGDGAALKEGDLSSIQNRVCIMVGESDNMVSPSESQWAANAVPNAEFKLLEGVVHPLEKNDPQQLATTITSFLKV